MPYSYLVESNGTHAFMMNGTTHQMEWSSTNASAVINSALGNLTVGRTWQEKVVLMGNFTIDSPIYVYSYTYLAINGRITLADWSNVSMIANAGAYAYFVTIEGGILYGNRDNNDGTSHGIYWYHTENNPLGGQAFLHIFDVAFHKIESDAIHIEGASGKSIGPVEVRGAVCWVVGGYGIYLKRVWDSWFQGLPFDGITGAIYTESGGDVHFHDSYLNNYVYFNGGTRGVVMEDIFYDVNDGEHAVRCRGVQFGQFSDIKIRINGDGDTTHSAIKLYDNGGYSCGNCTFNNIYAGRMWGTGTSQFKYVIEEYDANQNYNIYTNINGADSYTATLRVLGANSTYCNSTIIGDIVTS